MKKRNIFRKVAAFALALSMLAIPTTAFAAETDASVEETFSAETQEVMAVTPRGTFNPGDNYLGYVTVTKTNQAGGSTHVLKGSSIQVKPAWKAIDSESSEVNIRIWIMDETDNKKVFDHLFTPAKDTDGRKDDDGFWYEESAWEYNTLTSGHTYRFYYDVTTATGSSPTGSTRQALCYVWFNLS